MSDANAPARTPQTRLAHRLGLTVACALLPCCSGAIYSKFDFRTGQPAQDGTLAASLSARVPDADSPGARGAEPVSKATVLSVLGPPGEVLPLAAGDVFVYRLRLTDVDVINLNTSIFTGIIVPIYARIDGRQRDRVLSVQFDASGRVTALSEATP